MNFKKITAVIFLFLVTGIAWADTCNYTTVMSSSAGRTSVTPGTESSGSGDSNLSIGFFEISESDQNSFRHSIEKTLSPGDEFYIKGRMKLRNKSSGKANDVDIDYRIDHGRNFDTNDTKVDQEKQDGIDIDGYDFVEKTMKSIRIQVDDSGEKINVFKASGSFAESFDVVDGAGKFYVFMEAESDTGDDDISSAHSKDNEYGVVRIQVKSKPVALGYLDTLACNSVRGWARDPNKPFGSSRVRVYTKNSENSEKVYRDEIIANKVRPDTREGDFTGNYGFEWQILNELKNGAERIYEFYIVNEPDGDEIKLQVSNGVKNNISCAEPIGDTYPVFRLYSKVFQNHFYTSSVSENEGLLSDTNWKGEGVGWYAYKNSSKPNTVGIQRFVRKSNNNHFYVREDSSEYQSVLNDGNWTLEGVAFYVPKSSQGVEVYRFVGGNKDSHFYTTSVREKDVTIAKGDYTYEGVAFYGAVYKDIESMGKPKPDKDQENKAPVVTARTPAGSLSVDVGVQASIRLTTSDEKPESLVFSAWSSDEDIASVVVEGRNSYTARGVSVGAATLTLKIIDEFSKSTTHIVPIVVQAPDPINTPPRIVSRTPSDEPLSINEAGSQVVTLTVEDENPSDVRYEAFSNNDSIATVVHEGNGRFRVQGLTEGAAVITLSVIDDKGLSDIVTFTVQVSKVPLDDVLPGDECIVIANHSFEEAIHGMPSSWSASNWGGTEASFTQIDSATDGSYAGQIEVEKYVPGTDAKWRSGHIAINPNEKYDINMYLRGTADNTEVQAVLYNAQKQPTNYLWLGKVNLPAASNSWEERIVSFTALADTATVQIEYLVKSAGSVQIDDVWIGQGERSGNCSPPAIEKPKTGYVFSRTDTNEYRWIDEDEFGGSGNIWIDRSCADSLGGATETGDWNDLVRLAPAFDAIANPCDEAGNPGAGMNKGMATDEGYVFSRTDTVELRWIDRDSTGGFGHVWINKSCADRFGTPTVFGDWNALVTLAPGLDTAPNPCTSNTNPSPITDNPLPVPTGYVFSRTDKEEFRWIDITNSGVLGNVWISRSCSDSLGGPTMFGDWNELLNQAPGFDAIDSPCN